MNPPDHVTSPARRARRRFRRLRPRTRPRFAGWSFNRMLPSILTMLGLCAGLTSIRFAIDGRFGEAGAAIAVAAAIDGLDGRLARLLKATSRFGAEFDSLSDFLCFGVAPGFVLYLWSLQRFGGFGFAPCLLFAVCMALRLARFNAALEGPAAPPKPSYLYNFFTGVPAPAGAGVVLLPLFVGLEASKQGWDGLERVTRFPLLSAAMLIGTSLLLVSSLPVWSFKNFKIPSEYVLPMLLGIGLYAALLVADPWVALAGASLVYVGMLPFSRRSFLRLREAAEALREPEDEAWGSAPNPAKGPPPL